MSAISSSGMNGQIKDGDGEANVLRFLLDDWGLLLISSNIRNASFAALENEMKFSSFSVRAEDGAVGSLHDG